MLDPSAREPVNTRPVPRYDVSDRESIPILGVRLLAIRMGGGVSADSGGNGRERGLAKSHLICLPNGQASPQLVVLI